MEAIRRLLDSFRSRQDEIQYAPVHTSSASLLESEEGDRDVPGSPNPFHKEEIFSWLDYSIFVLLGVSMLWAWNMFLAAGSYFRDRFSEDPKLANNFQSAIISVSTVANLVTMFILTRMQRGVSYPWRIIYSLLTNILSFFLLALSAVFFTSVSPGTYLGFVLFMVFTTSVSTGFCQNGVFAFVNTYGAQASRYTQGVMTGQAIAGILPPITQIASAAMAAASKDSEDNGAKARSRSAFSYFLASASIALLIFFSFVVLIQRKRAANPSLQTQSAEGRDELLDAPTIAPPLRPVVFKLRYLGLGVFLTFAITMIFPVFSERILSTHNSADSGDFYQRPIFVPFAFLVWNTGDLAGRLLTSVPYFSLIDFPRLVLILAMARSGFVPLYLLCNIDGRGAKISSDAFYFLIQVAFGLSNGFLGSTCMMGAASWVAAEEREAAGSLMGLFLVAGLAAGALLSFIV